jgi:hypothetical protein
MRPAVQYALGTLQPSGRVSDGRSGGRSLRSFNWPTSEALRMPPLKPPVRVLGTRYCSVLVLRTDYLMYIPCTAIGVGFDIRSLSSVWMGIGLLRESWR